MSHVNEIGLTTTQEQTAANTKLLLLFTCVYVCLWFKLMTNQYTNLVLHKYWKMSCIYITN